MTQKSGSFFFCFRLVLSYYGRDISRIKSTLHPDHSFEESKAGMEQGVSEQDCLKKHLMGDYGFLALIFHGLLWIWWY